MKHYQVGYLGFFRHEVRVDVAGFSRPRKVGDFDPNIALFSIVPYHNVFRCQVSMDDSFFLQITETRCDLNRSTIGQLPLGCNSRVDGLIEWDCIRGHIILHISDCRHLKDKRQSRSLISADQLHHVRVMEFLRNLSENSSETHLNISQFPPE